MRRAKLVEAVGRVETTSPTDKLNLLLVALERKPAALIDPSSGQSLGREFHTLGIFHAWIDSNNYAISRTKGSLKRLISAYERFRSDISNHDSNSELGLSLGYSKGEIRAYLSNLGNAYELYMDRVMRNISVGLQVPYYAGYITHVPASGRPWMIASIMSMREAQRQRKLVLRLMPELDSEIIELFRGNIDWHIESSIAESRLCESCTMALRPS